MKLLRKAKVIKFVIILITFFCVTNTQVVHANVDVITTIVDKMTIRVNTSRNNSFINLCEGEQWFIDEVERQLNLNNKSLTNITSSEDFKYITAIGLENKGIEGKIPPAIGELLYLEEI